MKTALILAGAITLVLISMERPASGSPAPPPPEAMNDNEGLVRQKRDRRVPCTAWGYIGGNDCASRFDCCGKSGYCEGKVGLGIFVSRYCKGYAGNGN